MIRKILFPILTHVCSCIAFFVIFLLTWLGPEGGILLPLLPAPILFGATIILQMLAICIYIFIGIKSSSALKDTVCAACSILIINILCLSGFFIALHNIYGAIELTAVFAGSPFFFIFVLLNADTIVCILLPLLPSVLILLGAQSGRYIRRRRKTNSKKGELRS